MLRNPYILGGPQRQARGENQKWLPHPCLLGGPKEGGSATLTLHSWRSPTPSAGRNSEVATSLLPSRGPKRGRKCYVSPTLSEVPNAKRGEKLRSGCLTPPFSGAQKRAESLRNPCILGVPQRQARGENQKWLPSRRTKGGRKCYVTPTFSAVPNAKRREKIKSGGLTLVFSGSKRGRKCYVTPAFSAVPNAKRGEKIRKGCLLGGPKQSGSAMQPLHSGIPNAKRGEKIRSGFRLGGPKEGVSAT